MNYFSVKSKIATVAILLGISPFVGWAQVDSNVCLSRGYSIEIVNGVFTDEDGAVTNRDAVRYFFEKTYNGEPLTIDFLLNKTHSALDITDTAIQKTFEGVDMWDPDFLKMLNDASAQIKTQKILLVAHSQGNFYANNVYKVVTDDGDVSKKSIGVYGVASPATSVAGEGRHLTSSTDKIIAFLVENMLPGTIAPTNDKIDYKWSDDPMGHDFTKVYLEYRPQKIVDDIKWSLDKLSSDPTRSENVPCINPPKELSTLVKKIIPVVYTTKTAFVAAVTVATTGKNAAIGTAVGTYHLAVNTAVLTYHAGVAVISWTYNSTVALGNAVGNGTIKLASGTYSLIASAFSGGSSANSNSAAVILATQAPPQNVRVISPQSSVVNNKKVSSGIDTPAQPSSIKTQPSPSVIIFNLQAKPSSLSASNIPKLVFVGTFNPGSQQVLGSSAVSQPVAQEDSIQTEIDPLNNSGGALSAPALFVPQCDQTLATDGCLLATTTVRFEWTPVANAAYYVIDENGTNATTTETSADITVKDFSDYSLSVIAVGDGFEQSATSTQVVSVATIPIAINEIAWMGTVASSTGEWFELKNNTGNTINLSQWEMNAKDGTPHVKLTGTISPHAYLVFERISDNTIADVSAHQIYTGALGNSGEQLNLSYASTTLDQTPDVASSTWAAGYNSTSSKQTMERYSSKESGADPTNWGDNLVFISNGTDAGGDAIEGTPGEKNSVSYLINKGQDITTDTTLTPDDGAYVTAGTTVIASTTLTLDPGVEIKFYDGGKLFVEGSLNATGTPENPVILRSFDDNVSGGIVVWNGTATTTIGNALIENTSGIEAYGASSTLDISNTKFDGNEMAVELYSGAHASIASSTILNTFDNEAIGIYGSTMTIASTTIDGVINSGGIGLYGGTLSVSSSTINNISGGDGIGVYSGDFSIASSTVSNVSYDGVALYYATSTVENVNIKNGGAVGLDIYGGTATVDNMTVSGFSEGAGISVSAPTKPVSITAGEVSNNAVGVLMDVGTATIDNVSVHDNGVGPDDDIVIQ